MLHMDLWLFMAFCRALFIEIRKKTLAVVAFLSATRRYFRPRESQKDLPEMHPNAAKAHVFCTLRMSRAGLSLHSGAPADRQCITAQPQTLSRLVQSAKNMG